MAVEGETPVSLRFARKSPLSLGLLGMGLAEPTTNKLTNNGMKQGSKRKAEGGKKKEKLEKPSKGQHDWLQFEEE